MKGPFIQYELWKQCRNNCPCCFNRGMDDFRDKVSTINKVIDSIKSRDIHNGSISLIGGEFFDGELSNSKVKEAFYKLIDFICYLIQAKELQRGLICTSLMFSDTKDWEDFLFFISSRGVEDKFLICTSWDIKFRFDKISLANWERNMTSLKEKYPTIHKHVQMIMTGYFVTNYINNGFSVVDFENKWDCRVDFNVPIIRAFVDSDKKDMEKKLPGFFPKRKEFLDFLLLAKERGDIRLYDLLDVKNHSDSLIHSQDGKTSIEIPDRHTRRGNAVCCVIGPCTHKCCGYLDHDKFMRQDVEDFLAFTEASY